MPEFPLRSEGPCDLPDGSKVWVKTLNTLYKKRVNTAAELAGRVSSAPVRKGGSAYTATLAELKTLSSEEQAEFIAEQPMKTGSLYNQAEDLLPEPSYPDREPKEDEAAFTVKLDKYEKEKAKVLEKREAKVKELFESLKQKALNEAPKERLIWCLNACINDQFWNGFVQAHTSHTLYYATRDVDDHTEFYFGNDPDKGVKAVEDLDDAVKQVLLQKYNELDTVRSQEIPT